MKFEQIKPLIFFFPILLLQIFFVPLISIEGIAPDLILMLLVFYTLKNGQFYGTIFGFVCGLFFDFISGGILGSMMFSKTLSGFIAGYFFNENKTDLHFKSFSYPMIVLLITIIDSITISLITSFDINTNIITLFFYQGLLPGLYTSALCFFVTFFYPKRSYI
ncbi:MAG: rod shape-determining protein MreD [Ignavibacteria bacterium]|jgi:rod shape-determining protein MreD|nr:rod shape-determining protein MreD [Ignavibacteria bacterium]